MLHIHNGDSSAGIAKHSTISGEHFAWREALIGGPTPAGVTGKEWLRVRAQHLTEFYGVALDEAEIELRTQEERLASYPDHDEVVLWFEHDLFCQANLLYLLDWFAQRKLGKTKLSLICIGEFPGLPNFRGLGELSAEQMASLLGARQQVSAAQLNLATTAWQSYCSQDPSTIERLLETDTSALPFLRRAFRLHLERFPFLRNGLGRIENRGLEFINGGMSLFVDLFPRFCEAEPVYGLGDSQFWVALKHMADVKEPLLKTGNGADPDQKPTDDTVHKSAFEITRAGKSVLKAEADFVELNGIDIWLGGVHLSGKTDLWRWDDQRQRLTQR